MGYYSFLMALKSDLWKAMQEAAATYFELFVFGTEENHK